MLFRSGMHLVKIPRDDNHDADDLAKRASHRVFQRPGTFEERMSKPSAAPPILKDPMEEDPPPPPPLGAPDCGPPTGDRVVLALTRQEGIDWIKEIKDFLTSGILPESNAEAECITRRAGSYCIIDGDLYRKRPNEVALRCVSTEQGHELVAVRKSVV